MKDENKSLVKIDKEILELLTAKFQQNKPKKVREVNFEKLMKKVKVHKWVSIGSFFFLHFWYLHCPLLHIIRQEMH